MDIIGVIIARAAILHQDDFQVVKVHGRPEMKGPAGGL